MPVQSITEFGLGVDNTRNPSLLPPGFARQSINLLHNRGKNRAQLRNGITRLNHTRAPASDKVSYGLYQYMAITGTRTKLVVTDAGSSTANLYSIDTTKTAIKSGFNLATKVNFITAFGFWLMPAGLGNASNYNYIGNASAAYPYGVGSIGSCAVASGGAGSLTGTYYYTFAPLSSTTGELGTPSTEFKSYTAATEQIQFDKTLVGGITATEQFDQIRIYRTKVGTTGPYYKVADVAISALPYDDDASDASLTVLSTVHTLAGAAKVSRIEAANDAVFHRGRIHWLGLQGNKSRQRWTQSLQFCADSTTTARHDVEADDGDTLVRGFSIDGCLALFKEHSIHIMDGDVDEKAFAWQVASSKNDGIGAYAPWTAVSTPVGIIFMGENGIYVWRPRTGRPKLISGPDRQDPNAPSIQSVIDTCNQSQRLNFDAMYDPVERLYIISFAGPSQTVNDQTWVYSIESGTWCQFKYGMGQLKPTASALMHNSSSRLKAYFADQYGYVYETNTSNGNDGPISGTVAGTATGGSDTTVVDSGAAFYSTGDMLANLPVTVEKTGPLFETQLISSNNGTTLTTPSWTSDPAAADKYYVGALEGLLSLGRMDMGTPVEKWFSAINFEFQKQSSTVKLQVGWTIDGDSEPTTMEAILQTGGFKFSIPVERMAVGISPYIRIIGTSASFELIRMEIEYLNMGTALPKH